MTGLYRLSSALLIAAVLSGCGTQGLSPVAAVKAPVSASAIRAVSALNGEPEAKKLINDYKAIQGFEVPQMEARIKLVTALGDTDSDMAAEFLQAEYEQLAVYPEAVRPALETSLIDALIALDTYFEDEDEAAIKAGPGTTVMQAATYADAMARKKRRKGLLHWAGTPFRWVGKGMSKFWNGLTGKKKPKKRRKPRPAPMPMPDPGYPPPGY